MFAFSFPSEMRYQSVRAESNLCHSQHTSHREIYRSAMSAPMTSINSSTLSAHWIAMSSRFQCTFTKFLSAIGRPCSNSTVACMTLSENACPDSCATARGASKQRHLSCLDCVAGLRSTKRVRRCRTKLLETLMPLAGVLFRDCPRSRHLETTSPELARACFLIRKTGRRREE
jgi:hypothetical protein